MNSDAQQQVRSGACGIECCWQGGDRTHAALMQEADACHHLAPQLIHIRYTAQVRQLQQQLAAREQEVAALREIAEAATELQSQDVQAAKVIELSKKVMLHWCAMPALNVSR